MNGGTIMDMLDNFLGKAKDVYDVATKKTGEFVEVSKLKMESVKINNDIKKLYEKLGNSVYGMMKANYENQDIVNALVEEIDEKLESLSILSAKISDMKNISLCKACGAKNPEDNFYCYKCGARIKTEFEDIKFTQDVE